MVLSHADAFLYSPFLIALVKGLSCKSSSEIIFSDQFSKLTKHVQYGMPIFLSIVFLSATAVLGSLIHLIYPVKFSNLLGDL